ncbi:MAG: hypothetical protein GY948_25180 [Alphaproteobacteria bacterium]|nr:hypothetical protein [Alphaproteobacteria bacterium]
MRRAEIKQRRVADAQDELLQAALSWHHHSDGVYDLADHRLTDIQEHIQISADIADSWPPPFLLIGRKSTTAELFGSDFAKGVAGQPGLPDRTLENLVNARYRHVSESGEAAFDTVTCTIVPPNRTPVGVVYDRLILPSKFSDGSRTFSVFTVIQKKFAAVSSSSGDLLLHSTPASRRH